MANHADDPKKAEVQFPLTATIAGIAVVTIPLAEYAALLECRQRVGARNEAAKRYAVPPRAPIEKDAEVRAFFEKRLGKMDMLAILADCRQQFGPKRTPSRTAAYDFWGRLRRQTADGA